MHKLYIKNPKIKKDEKGSEQQYNWLQKVRNGAANSSIEGSEREQRGQRNRAERATKEGCKKGGKEDKKGAAKERNKCKRPRQARKARWQDWWEKKMR